MVLDYESLLKKAKKELPKDIESSERFEIPKATGHIQGNKTIINNFNQIVNTFRRPQEHLLKYLQKELATPAQIDGHRLILGRKINPSFINKKIAQYAKEFVLCKECNKPDTKMIKEGDKTFLKCAACGAKNSVRSRI